MSSWGRCVLSIEYRQYIQQGERTMDEYVILFVNDIFVILTLLRLRTGRIKNIKISTSSIAAIGTLENKILLLRQNKSIIVGKDNSLVCICLGGQLYMLETSLFRLTMLSSGHSFFLVRYLCRQNTCFICQF